MPRIVKSDAKCTIAHLKTGLQETWVTLHQPYLELMPDTAAEKLVRHNAVPKRFVRKGFVAKTPD